MCAATLIALTLLLTACDEPKDEPLVTYDDSTLNMRVVGDFSGMNLDLDVVDDESIEGERQYRGPHLEGTDPVDEVPDVTATALCEIEMRVVGQVDGVDWDIELQLENFDPGTLGTRTYDVVSPDASITSDALAVEFQMENDDAVWERTAVSGAVDLILYSSDDTHPDNDDVELGGYLGGTFYLEFGPGEVLEGAFRVPISEDDIKGKEC